MDKKDIVRAPTDILLFTWLYNLIEEEHASYNLENDNIIELDSYASSCFTIGRDNEKLNSFLGVPKNLIPWFAQIPWKSAVVDFERSIIFISCGDENEIGLTIGIKVRRKRIELLWNNNIDDNEVSDLSFRVFAVKADSSISISEKIFAKVPLKKSSDLAVVVMKTFDESSAEDVYADDIRARYDDLYANKYLNVSSDDDFEL